MKKFFKILLVGFIVLLAIIILIPVIFKNKIYKTVKEEANKSLNAKFDFVDFNVSIFRSFPALSVELTKLSLVGINEFEGDTLVGFKTFYADVNVWSVIAGNQIKINAIELDQPHINAKVLKSGKANWDIVKDTTKASPADTVKSEPTKFKIALKRFEIKNAMITYDDQTLDVLAKIVNLNFLLKGDLTDERTDLKMKTSIDSLTTVYSKIKYLNKAKIEYNAEIDADMNAFKFTFKDNLFKLNDLELAFSGWVEMPKDDIGMDMVFSSKKTDFKSVLSLVPAVYMTDFKDVKTAGSFALKGYAKGIYNDKTLPAFGGELVVENGNFKYPSLPKSVDNINIAAKLDNEGGTGDNNLIDISKFHLEIAQNPINASLHVKTTKADVNMNGNVNGKIDLVSLKDVIPLKDMSIAGLIAANLDFGGNLSSIMKQKYQDFKADGKIELTNFVFNAKDVPPVVINKSVLAFNPKVVALESFDSKIGRSDLQLSGKIDNILQYVFKGELLTANFVMTSKLLDLNEFMSGSSDTTKTATTDTTALTAFEIPKNINFKLSTNLAKIKMLAMDIDNTVGVIQLSEGKAMLDKLKMNMLKGSMVVSGSYDSREIKKPATDFDLNITNIDIPTTFNTFVMVQKMAPIAKNCDGAISAKLKLALNLDYHLNPILNTLNSEGNFKSSNIGIKNAKLLNAVADATKMEKFRNPALKNVDISYIIKDGNLSIRPTKMNIAGSDVTFEGTQNLNQTINYNIGMNVAPDLAGKILSKLPLKNSPKNIDINLVVGGTVTEPKIVKIKSSLTDNAKDEVTEKVNEVKKDVKGEAKKILDDANAQAQKIIAEAEKQAQVIRDNAKIAADKIVSEADTQGKNLVAKANNILAKKAAEEGAKQLNKQAKDKSDKLLREADEQVNSIINAAKSKADKTIKEAQDKANAL